jgi:hypothetical protein
VAAGHKAIETMVVRIPPSTGDGYFRLRVVSKGKNIVQTEGRASSHRNYAVHYIFNASGPLQFPDACIRRCHTEQPSFALVAKVQPPQRAVRSSSLPSAVLRLG